MNRILIGTVTHEDHEYVLDRFISALKEIDYPDYDILLVDTSEGWDYYDKLDKIPDIKVYRGGYNLIPEKRIANGLNILRKHVLDGGYSHLFSIDSDIIVDPDILKRLVERDKELVGPPVAVGNMPCVFRSFKQIKIKDGYSIDYMPWSELGSEFRKVPATGLGCLLIRRNILKLVKFKFRIVPQWAPDVIFLTECAAKGFEFWCDPTIKVEHQHRGGNWEKVRGKQSKQIESRLKEIKRIALKHKDKSKENESSFDLMRVKLDKSKIEAPKVYDMLERGKKMGVWV